MIIGLGGFGAFAIAESRAHRRAERKSRDREIKLSSIDPYLVLIADDAEAAKVKVALAHSVFVHLPLQETGEDENPAEGG